VTVQNSGSFAVRNRRPTGDDEVLVCVDDEMLHDGLADLRWLLHDALVAGARRVVVDMARVQRLSSPVVATLLSAHRTCRARGGGVVLRGANHRTEDVLRRTGLWRVLCPEMARDGAA
jgi:anti-anti-sigma factor